MQLHDTRGPLIAAGGALGGGLAFAFIGYQLVEWYFTGGWAELLSTDDAATDLAIIVVVAFGLFFGSIIVGTAVGAALGAVVGRSAPGLLTGLLTLAIMSAVFIPIEITAGTLLGVRAAVIVGLVVVTLAGGTGALVAEKLQPRAAATVQSTIEP